MISKAVKTGVHRELDTGRTVIVHRIGGNVVLYKGMLAEMFADVWEKS